MDLDPDLLLTAENLRLETGLVRGQRDRGAVALKRLPSQTYLVVDSLQAQVLEEFAQPRNVPAVLENCIRKRICPPLREFYDLVAKAHRAGILRSEELGAEGPPAAPAPPVRWFLTLPARLVLPFAAVAAVATLAVVILRAPVLPATALAVLEGWAIACAALSLGHALAAAVLHGAEGEVHRPRLDLLSPTPHFTFDLRETCMLARKARVAVFAMTVVPLALATAAGLWFRLPWATVTLGALFFACRPAGGGFVGRILPLLRRRPLIDTDGPPLFEASSSLREEWRAAWRRFDGRVASLQFALGVAWAFALGAEAYRIWGVPLLRAWESRAEWRFHALAVVGSIVVVLTFAAAVKVQHRVVDACAIAGRRWIVAWRRWRGKLAKIDPAMLEEQVRKNPLLRRLDPDAQAELLECLQPLESRPWREIVAFGAEPTFVGLVVSGRATVYKRHKSGRRGRFFQIVEGDLFGAHKLFDPVHGDLAVRADTPFVAAMIPCEAFQRLVVDRLGAPVVSRYVQSHLFLQRASSLCAEWRPAAVARFAELATTMSHPAGGKIIAQGQEVGSLYVLYDGQARAVRNRKPLGKIRPGDVFGEVSLLQTSAATADVETKEDSRCLLVNRVEFIRFMSRNHHVALQLERMCSSRLGRPIFPLTRETFDAP